MGVTSLRDVSGQADPVIEPAASLKPEVPPIPALLCFALLSILEQIFDIHTSFFPDRCTGTHAAAHRTKPRGSVQIKGEAHAAALLRPDPPLRVHPWVCERP
jgi:hypothetical protein